MAKFEPEHGTLRAPATAKVPRAFKEPFARFRDETIGSSETLKELGAFEGPFVAQVDPAQTGALGGLENLANLRIADNPAAPVLDAANRFFTPEFSNPAQDPTFLNALQAILRPLEQSRDDQLNRQRAIAAGSGASLSDRAFIAEQATNEGVDRTVADTAAQFLLAEQARRDELQTGAAPQLLAGALGLEETPHRLLGEVGEVRRGFEQEFIEGEKAAFEEQIQAALRPLAPFQTFFSQTGLPFAIDQGGGGGGGSNALGSILSLALGGAALGLG